MQFPGSVAMLFTMNAQPSPISVSDDLVVRIDGPRGTANVRIAPTEALAFAEQLVRAGFRRIMADEALLQDAENDEAH